MNRELWLHMMTELLDEHYARSGHRLPENIRFSCGRTSKRKYAGECWSEHNSKDGTFEIFISPHYDDSLEVACILSHELCHVAVGVDKKHGKIFRQCANDAGLTGNPASSMPGEELTAIIKKHVERLGKYPHAELMESDHKKDTTRLIKLICPDCGYTVRTTQKWIDKGLPYCNCMIESDIDKFTEYDLPGLYKFVIANGNNGKETII